MRSLLALAFVVLLSGCFSEILPSPIKNGTDFMCAALNRDKPAVVMVQSWIGEGVDVERGLAVSALQSQLQEISGRSVESVRSRERQGPVAPSGGWTIETVHAWSMKQPVLASNVVVLTVLWLATWEDGNSTGANPAPGAIVLSQQAIELAAEELSTTRAVVARAVLLHHAGHALGAVNRGLPIQDPAIQEREGPPGHDPNPASVLHVGWEDARTVEWAPNGAYDRYPDSTRRDWEAAIQPGGVCL